MSTGQSVQEKVNKFKNVEKPPSSTIENKSFKWKVDPDPKTEDSKFKPSSPVKEGFKSSPNLPTPFNIAINSQVEVIKSSSPTKGDRFKNIIPRPRSSRIIIKKDSEDDPNSPTIIEYKPQKTPKTPTSPRNLSSVEIFLPEKEKEKEKRSMSSWNNKRKSGDLNKRKSAPVCTEEILKAKSQLSTVKSSTLGPASSHASDPNKRRSNVKDMLLKNFFQSPEEENVARPENSKRVSRKFFFSPEEEEKNLDIGKNQVLLEPEPGKQEFLSVLSKMKQKRLLSLKQNTEELSEALEDGSFDREEFIEFSEKRLVLIEFNFFEIYQKYQKEKGKKQRTKLEKELNSIIQDGSTKFSIELNKKFTKEKLKDLQVVYEEVYVSLSPIFQEFVKKKQQEEIFTPVRDQFNKGTVKVPNTFEDLILDKEVYKLFSNYVCDHYGENYISLFDDLLKYRKENTPELKKKLLKYCKIDSKENVLFNVDIRNQIIIKDNFQSNWDNYLYSIVYKILSDEYYPRFIFSQLWKDYLKTTMMKIKNAKFSDSYSVLKIEKKIVKFSTTTEICSVWNNVTNEPFSAKRILSSSIDVKNETLKYLDHIQHSNIIQFVEIFSEDIQLSKKNCLTIITSEINENLHTYLESFEQGSYLDSLELTNFMKQILLAVEQFHKKSKYFEIGKLTEKTIYVSLEGRVSIDPGFYTDIDKKFPSYFKPPEDLVSENSDIFAVGLIFFRMMTLLKSNEIEKLFENQSTNGKLGVFKDFLKQTPPYFTNMKKELLVMKKYYDERIIDLVLQLIDPNPDHRTQVSDSLAEIQKIMIKLMSRQQISRSQRFGSLNQNQIFVLQDDICRCFLKEYLRTEVATECILFFEDVQIFSKLASDKERFAKAEEIFQSYLLPTSPLEINISGKLQKNFSQEFIESKQEGNISSEIFEDILKHVTDTVILDSFPRFQNSRIRKDLENYPLLK
jgi:hypothetical protein